MPQEVLPGQRAAPQTTVSSQGASLSRVRAAPGTPQKLAKTAPRHLTLAAPRASAGCGTAQAGSRRRLSRYVSQGGKLCLSSLTTSAARPASGSRSWQALPGQRQRTRQPPHPRPARVPPRRPRDSGRQGKPVPPRPRPRAPAPGRPGQTTGSTPHGQPDRLPQHADRIPGPGRLCRGRDARLHCHRRPVQSPVAPARSSVTPYAGAATARAGSVSPARCRRPRTNPAHRTADVIWQGRARCLTRACAAQRIRNRSLSCYCGGPLRACPG